MVLGELREFETPATKIHAGLPLLIGAFLLFVIVAIIVGVIRVVLSHLVGAALAHRIGAIRIAAMHAIAAFALLTFTLAFRIGGFRRLALWRFGLNGRRFRFGHLANLAGDSEAGQGLVNGGDPVRHV